MTTRFTAVAAALLCASSMVAAQDVNTVPDRWSVGSELGLNAARGNSSYTMLTAGLRFTHLQKEAFEFDWSSALTYGESNGAVIARRMLTSVKGDFHPKATISPFLFASVERDVIRRLDLVTSSGAGVKYTFFRDAHGSASISGAALHQYKSIVPLPPVGGVSPPAEPQGSTARLSIRPKGAYKLKSGVTFEQTSFWQPEIGKAANFNAEITSRVGFAVTKSGTLFIQHTYRDDSQPPIGVKRTDQLLVAGVKLQY